MQQKIISYNVNGLRSAVNKGLWNFFREKSPDVFCLQEIKAMPDDLAPDVRNPVGYHSYFMPAEKKGYSGVAIYSRKKPNHVEYGCGDTKYDREGRILRADFDDYSVMSLYLPSGTMGDERQSFKEMMMGDFAKYCKNILKKVPRLVICGDFNICHKEIDIHNPVSNKNSSGFLPHERAWVSEFLDLGFVDSLRMFKQDPGLYTWWTFRANARPRNLGWRIDYHMVSEDLAPACKDHVIYANDIHSDHCGIELTLEL